MAATLLRGATLADGTVADVRIDVATIVDVGPGLALRPGEEVHDLAGWLLLPAPAEPHAHLDKALTADLVDNPVGDLLGAIVGWDAVCGSMTVDDFAGRARASALRLLASGCTAVRSHVNVGGPSGLRAVEALLGVRAELAPLMDLQLVALIGTPTDPGLLCAALDMGVDVVGGCPHLDVDPIRCIETTVGIAADRGLSIDLHMDETLDPGALWVRDLARIVGPAAARWPRAPLPPHPAPGSGPGSDLGPGPAPGPGPGSAEAFEPAGPTPRLAPAAAEPEAMGSVGGPQDLGLGGLPVGGAVPRPTGPAGAASFGGRPTVTASHCVSHGMQDEPTQRAVAEELAAADVAVVTLPQTNLFLQARGAATAPPRGLAGLHALLAAGVTVAGGADNLQDAFNTVGRADPLETAALLVMAGHLSPTAAYEAVTTASRRALGLPAVGVAVGSPAELLAVKAPSLRAAIADAPPDRMVFAKGRLVAHTTSRQTIARA